MATGFATEIITFDVPDALGDGSGFTLKDNTVDANTTIEVPIYSWNTLTNELTSQTKYLDITKTTYVDSSGEQTLTYTWNPETYRLTIQSTGNEKVYGTQIDNNYTGDFIINGYGHSNGGVIGSGVDITSVDANFIGSGAYLSGGAIFNSNPNPPTELITGNYIGNYTAAYGGGAISNRTHSELITGNFIGNHSNGSGGVLNNVGGTIDTLDGTYIANSGNDGGGALENSGGTVHNLKGTYALNTGRNQGGALLNVWSGRIDNIIGANFLGNSANKGGAIGNNNSTIGFIDENENFSGGIVNSNFIANHAQSQGGAIYNSGTMNIEDSNFIGNYAKSESGTAQGGAIWTNKDLNVIADNGTSTFKDNYVQVGDGEKDYQAIWVDGADKKLNLQQFNNGKMYMYDNINGTDGYTVNIEGDGTGTMYLYNDIKNANVGFDNTTINTVNNDIHTYEFNSLALNSNTKFVADVDLVNEQMDHIETGNNYTITDGAKLTVSGMNLLNDAEKENTKIFFAEEDLANNVDTTVKTVSYSPIYKYDVKYMIDEDDNKGYFMFARGANGGGGNFNPAVIEAPVAAQAGAMATMQNTFNYSFASSDSFMDMPSIDRKALIDRNKYAIEQSELTGGTNPLYQPVDTTTVWVKPYASFENIPLDNGPAVRTISYGTLVGYDTDFKELKKGWTRNWTGYIGYNGASMHYSNVDTYQNGGLIGGTLSLYKGNFFNATTISTGATVSQSDTMYGHENNTSLLAGIGNKTGYNIEFKGGRYIIQPNIFIGYTFVKTFDFKNAAGVNIESKPFNNLQLSPGVKFIMNTKNGWQPYIGVNMVWNVLNKSDVTANGVHLPNMSIRPYIQYGIGIQKKVKDNFTAYGQAMVQNGGRNGISLTAGMRWAIGKNHKNIEKVENPKNEIKVSAKSSEFKKVKQTGEKHVLKEAKKPINLKISTINED